MLVLVQTEGKKNQITDLKVEDEWIEEVTEIKGEVN